MQYLGTYGDRKIFEFSTIREQRVFVTYINLFERLSYKYNLFLNIVDFFLFFLFLLHPFFYN